MDEEPSTSSGIIHSIPQELQDEVDLIASNLPRVTGLQSDEVIYQRIQQRDVPTQLGNRSSNVLGQHTSTQVSATSADLTDNQKRWLVVGICLHSVIVPALRTYIVPIFTALYKELIRNYKIDTQIYPTHLQQYQPTHAFLNYEVVNNNIVQYGYQRNRQGIQNANYDYKIKNCVDLSKLFLQTHMVHYTGFDETCDSSALLGLIINIDKFPPLVKSDAEDVRRNLRNPWAHCDLTTWDSVKYSNAFKLMEKLVLDLSLSSNEEKQIIGKLKKWEINGEQFLSGTPVGLELVNEMRQQTCVLGKYARLIGSRSDESFTKINNELEKIDNLLLNKIAQLEKDVEEMGKRMLAQDKILKNQNTQLADFNKTLSRYACHDSHMLEMELWIEQEAMFVETPVVEDILQILESEHSVLIVGEPGIGKSMLMHHIALSLHSTSNYNIIPCFAIKDIIQYYKEGIKQMFVLDDIWGPITASVDETEFLRKNGNLLNKMLGKGQTKIAATCRLDIYSEENVHASCTVLTSNIFNLSKKYSKENKLTICAKYLTETNIQLLKDENEEFTPLMCYLYSKNENFKLTDFLHCPYETYQKEWDRLKSIDPHKYCALFLCVLHNGIAKESLFDIFSENNISFKNSFEICGLSRETSRCKIKTVFDSIIGTYVRKTSNEYRVIHDQMFDFMCGYFGSNDMMVICILRDACIQVLNERTQLKSIDEKRRTFSILIPHKHEQAYFERIQNELQLGNQKECFRNPQMNHDKYRASFIKVLKSIDDKFLFEEIHPGTFSKRCNESFSKFLITSCSRGYYDVVQFYISKDADVKNIAFIKTPLTAACEEGYENIVTLLIDKGCDINKADGKGQTPLTAACIGGNENVVQLLIAKGCNVKKAHGKGQTPLTAACEGGNEKIVQLLIDKGCNVQKADGKGQTPSTAACEGGNAKIVQLLIDKGCNVYKADGKGHTPLTVACLSGNVNIVKLLIYKGCNVNKADGMGQTPLTVACIAGHEKVVQLLIAKGCNVNQADSMRQTPLTAACIGGNEKVVQLLIAKGCNVNQAADSNGQTLLTAACRRGHVRIVQLLIDEGCKVNPVNSMEQTPLLAACFGRHEKVVQLLIDEGCNVNHRGFSGETALTYACMFENEKIVQLLIENGCDVNQDDATRESPLVIACSGGREKTVRLLIDKGCEINERNGMGRTPLTAACEEGHETTVQLLIDKGCDVNQADGMGRTPLTVACEEGTENIVQLLIDKGCNVNHVDGMNQTPLTAALKGGNENIVQLLKDNGCNVNHVDETRQTPLFGEEWNVNQACGDGQNYLICACKLGKKELVQIFLKGGCNINHTDKMGYTPLIAACEHGHEKVVQLLIDKGCDINKSGSTGVTPFSVARRRGNTNIIQLLKDKGCSQDR